MEYIKNGDIISVVSERIDLKEVDKRLKEIEKEIEEVEKLPDVVRMPNNAKLADLRMLYEEKEHLEKYKEVK